MNLTTLSRTVRPQRLVAVAVAAMLFAACATAPVKPDGSVEVRAKLTRLESNPDLATRAPDSLKEAQAAVVVAEIPQADPEVGRSNVYLADRKVDIAMSRAQTKFLEDQRDVLTQQRDKARLDERTREVEVANRRLATAHDQLADKDVQVQVARAEAGAANASAANSEAAAGAANLSAANSQAEAGAARQSAAESQAAAADLQRQVDDLHARATDHGMVITLGDVMFGTAKAELRTTVVPNLDRLVKFLNHYPDRSVAVAGYTDNRGSNDYNLGLSERRANTVKVYLTQGGVDARRISTTGMGPADPVADNESSEGRQQNRRVEVTISNAPAASR